ncbi:hypothetical protein ACFL37_01565 [Candidatus Margulisiibacteriota bacterium]
MSGADAAKMDSTQIVVRGRVPSPLDKTCKAENLTYAQKRQKTTFELDGKPLPWSLKDVDNTSLGKELTITGRPCRELTVTVENKLVFETVYLTILESGKLTLPFAEVLRHVPLDSKVKITIFDGQNYKTLKKTYLSRSSMGLTPDPAKITREIAPLYQEIAADLKAGKPLVINTHVVLWDDEFGSRKAKWSNGNDPKTNLYWGWGAGIYTKFKKNKQWQLVKDDEKIAVFKREFKPSQAWQDLGVTKPFEVYVVLNLHYAKEIDQGYKTFARDLFGQQARTINLDNGQELLAGGKSRVTGLISHLNPEGPDLIQQARTSLPSFKKGVFMTTCLSARFFAEETVSQDIFPLLFNTDFIAAEGYTFPPFFEAIAKAKPGKSLAMAARAGYQAFHPKVRIPSKYFVNASHGLSDYLFTYDGDQDKDGLLNRIDPEPRIQNIYDNTGKKLVIQTSDGTRLEITKNQ